MGTIFTRPLVPRRPIQRMQWRLTALFAVATVLSVTLAWVLMASLVIFLLVFTPAMLTDLEQVLREKEPSILSYLAGNEPDRRALTRMLDKELLDQDVDEGIRFKAMVVTTGKFAAAIANADGTILAASPDDLPFVPGTPLLSCLTTASERALAAAARRGVRQARWDGSRVIAAGPIRRGGRVVATAFVRSEPLYSGAKQWRGFAADLAVPLVWTSLGACVVGSVVGFWGARSVTRRLFLVSATADRWAQGDLRAQAPESPPDELGLLARRLNHMAGDLQQVLDLRNAVAVLEERQRITRDLHDTVKQEAFAVAMIVGSAQQNLDNGDLVNLRHALAEASNLSHQMQTTLSGILTQMRNEPSLPLAERLEAIAAVWQRRSGRAIHWQCGCVPGAVAAATVENVARIVEEAIANAVKHSRGQRVTLRLERPNASYRVTIDDDGVGLDVGTVRNGWGLATMRERTALLPGGRLDIARSAEGGARVTLHFRGEFC